MEIKIIYNEKEYNVEYELMKENGGFTILKISPYEDNILLRMFITKKISDLRTRKPSKIKDALLLSQTLGGHLRLYYYYWRKYASIFILIFQIISTVYCNNLIQGIIILLWLTVPCGIKLINNNKYLWWIRQTAFLLMVIAEIGLYMQMTA